MAFDATKPLTAQVARFPMAKGAMEAEVPLGIAKGPTMIDTDCMISKQLMQNMILL